VPRFLVRGNVNENGPIAVRKGWLPVLGWCT
jgi:hypothetical protein